MKVVVGFQYVKVLFDLSFSTGYAYITCEEDHMAWWQRQHDKTTRNRIIALLRRGQRSV